MSYYVDLTDDIPGSRSALGDVTSRANQSIAGAKRTASDLDVENIDLRGAVMDDSCDQVRRKIRNSLDAGEMKKGEFAKELGVSAASVNNFLAKNGRLEGSGSDAYGAAWEFFKRRELAGIKPAKKQKTTAASTNANATPDIGGISLEGEESDSVPVFDSCDEIRKKISAYFTKTGTTQAQFCRDLQAQKHCEDKKIQSKQLADFRSKKGANAGNTSIVFYTSYVFFEKLRLAEGKEKSKHRLGMEGAHPGGFNITRPSNRGFWCRADQRPHVDNLGRVGFY